MAETKTKAASYTMNWLITTKVTNNLTVFDSKLSTWGAELMCDAPPIPLGDDELVVQVRGPRDLPQKVAADDSILLISPNSTLELY